jgi:hypothetical protein
MSRKENAASLNAEAANAVVGISNRDEATAYYTPPAAGSGAPADYDDIEFARWCYIYAFLTFFTRRRESDRLDIPI